MRTSWMILQILLLVATGCFQLRAVSPSAQFRNPGLMESVIGSKEYEGFIYPVCDDDDPEYWEKVYAATRWREQLRRPEVIKVEMKGMSEPFYVLTIANGLPLAYNSTRLEISTVLSKCPVRKFFEYADRKLTPYKVGIGEVIGLKTIKFKRIPGTYKYILDIPANRTSKFRAWIVYFISYIPMYPPAQGFEEFWRYGNAEQRLIIIQFPKRPDITIEDLNRASGIIRNKLHRYFLGDHY